MGRTSVIAITQFVFLTLGSMALRVLIGANAIHPSGFRGSMAAFLAANSWWLVATPALWALYANVAGRVNKGPLRLDIAQGIGVLFAACIVGAFGFVILLGG